MRLSRLYLWLIAASLVAVLGALAIEISGVLMFRHAETVFGAGLLILAYGVVGLCCAAVYENGKAPRLMRSGMAIGAMALIGWLVYCFSPNLPNTMTGAKVLIGPTMWCAFVAVAGGLLLLPMHSSAERLTRHLALGLTFTLAAFVAGAMIFHPVNDWATANWSQLQRYEEVIYRVGGVITVLASGSVATTVVFGLVGALTGSRRHPIPTREPSPYWLKCPRCNAEQQAMTGEHRCIRCRLRTRVELT